MNHQIFITIPLLHKLAEYLLHIYFLPKTFTSCSIRIPEDNADDLSQDREYCFLKNYANGADIKIGFHEYDKIYSIPGLYEQIFYDFLRCVSPQKICALLIDALKNDKRTLKSLCAFDLGAGNGIAGELLQKQGIPRIYGLDIIPEAKAAAKRDRPNVYQKYYLGDLTHLRPLLREELISKEFNCMVSAGSLGFGDICVTAFQQGLNLLVDGAWVVFSIHSDFLTDNGGCGFCSFYHEIIDSRLFDVLHRESYCHRLSAKGTPIYYTAVLGKKLKNVPDSLVEEFINF